MDTGTLVLIACFGVFVASVLVYVLFMVFLPEWVGITGKVAKSIEKSHEEGSVDTTDAAHLDKHGFGYKTKDPGT
ncbi:MAG: hypothetical protein KF767_09655 [Bdellovibrionaceae bacterium]|nr:hypothetical protein [Pseudobdellovibrionaceae bacterium]